MLSPHYFVPVRNNLYWVLFSLKGRIPRRTFWRMSIFTKFGFLVSLLVIAALGGLLEYFKDVGNEALVLVSGMLIIVCYLSWFLTVIWIGFALQIKRLHDMNKSSAWLMINWIPLVGNIWSLIELYCLPGTQGHNLYGPDALQDEATDETFGSQKQDFYQQRFSPTVNSIKAD